MPFYVVFIAQLIHFSMIYLRYYKLWVWTKLFLTEKNIKQVKTGKKSSGSEICIDEESKFFKIQIWLWYKLLHCSISVSVLNQTKLTVLYILTYTEHSNHEQPQGKWSWILWHSVSDQQSISHTASVDKKDMTELPV